MLILSKNTFVGKELLNDSACNLITKLFAISKIWTTQQIANMGNALNCAISA